MGVAQISKQRKRKFVTKILRKTCSSLVKIISDGENNFTQNKCNKLQKIRDFFEKINVKTRENKNKNKRANMGPSTVQLHGVDLIDIQIQNWF